ncbi:hypothetical protein ACFLY7_01720 [Patescibacteria group bacterium]
MENKFDFKKISLLIAVLIVVVGGAVWLYVYNESRLKLTEEQKEREEVFESLTKTSEEITETEREDVFRTLQQGERGLSSEERRNIFEALENQ